MVVPQNLEFTLEFINNCVFRVRNGVLEGRTIDAFTWYKVVSFSIADIEDGRLGCLECCHR